MSEPLLGDVIGEWIVANPWDTAGLYLLGWFICAKLILRLPADGRSSPFGGFLDRRIGDPRKSAAFMALYWPVIAWIAALWYLGRGLLEAGAWLLGSEEIDE